MNIEQILYQYLFQIEYFASTIWTEISKESMKNFWPKYEATWYITVKLH